MLAMKLRSMGKDAIQPEVKEYVIQECKKILLVIQFLYLLFYLNEILNQDFNMCVHRM